MICDVTQQMKSDNLENKTIKLYKLLLYSDMLSSYVIGTELSRTVTVEQYFSNRGAGPPWEAR